MYLQYSDFVCYLFLFPQHMNTGNMSNTLTWRPKDGECNLSPGLEVFFIMFIVSVYYHRGWVTNFTICVRANVTQKSEFSFPHLNDQHNWIINKLNHLLGWFINQQHTQQSTKSDTANIQMEKNTDYVAKRTLV